VGRPVDENLQVIAHLEQELARMALISQLFWL
jgi:hypothetical protein